MLEEYKKKIETLQSDTAAKVAEIAYKAVREGITKLVEMEDEDAVYNVTWSITTEMLIIYVNGKSIKKLQWDEVPNEIISMINLS